MNFLRQSTASQSRAIGPFVDDTDFKTAETGLTIANTDIKLMSSGGASANKNSGGGTHRVNGWYGVTFDATDTATVGELQVSVVVSGALPVFKTFYVLEEAAFDAIFAASAAPATAAGVSAVETDTQDIQARLPAALVSGRIDASVGAMAANVMTAAAAAADLTTELQSGLATAAALDTVDNFLDTEIAAIKAVTDLLPDGGALTSLATQASVNTIDDFLDTEVAAIKAKTDQLTFTVANRVDSTTQAGLSTLDAAGVRSAVGLASANLDTQLDALPTAAENATAAFTTALTESYAADGAAPTLAQALFAIQQFLQERAVSGTTLTVKKLDGTTAAMTFTLDDGTAPTSITRAT